MILPLFSGTPTLIRKALEMYESTLARLDGYVPPRVPDMQGPLNTASLIWDQQEFFMAMHEEPEAVHHLLDLVTNYLIAIFRYFKESYPRAELLSWPHYHMPQHLGVGMTEDLMPLLSH